MAFQSILSKRTNGSIDNETPEMPGYFADLNLDQLINVITTGKQDYGLKPFYYMTLNDIDEIRYRQAIAQDLEDKTLFQNIRSFTAKMIILRRHMALIDKSYYTYHKEGLFLEAVDVYCDAIHVLLNDLNSASLNSPGFIAFREYVTHYANSEGFRSLLMEMKQLKTDLSAIDYCVIIKGGNVKVRKYKLETDYSLEVEKAFEKFRQGTVRNYTVDLGNESDMDHVEAQILDCVARLYPDVFSSLDQFCAQHGNFQDETILVFDREIQFYIAYLEFIDALRNGGMKFCYPRVTNNTKEVYDYEGFDLVLAHKRIHGISTVVCNDFFLKGPERVIVVSGPNQGGKTTFARTFGQLHYLASLGLPVPGREAQLFLFDHLFTHFEKEEDIKDLRGKLEDDLVRINEIFNHATPKSILIMNEIFTSTTLEDAVFLGRIIMGNIIQLDLLCVFVTFMDELASYSEKTVSMVSTVDPENPAQRTYKIVRQPADGLAYALSIVEKYRLSYNQLMERVKI